MQQQIKQFLGFVLEPDTHSRILRRRPDGVNKSEWYRYCMALAAWLLDGPTAAPPPAPPRPKTAQQTARRAA